MLPPGIKLRHLQALVAIAEEGTLVRAAAQLSVSQPAVTKTLAELEALVGHRLVERGRRGVQPTPAGRILLRHATAGLAALQAGIEGISRAGGGSAPPVLVGAAANAAATVLPEAVRRLREAEPAARVHLRGGSTVPLLASLRQGRLDLVVGRLADAADMQGLAFEPLFTEPLVLVVRPGHALADRPCLAPAALRGMALMLPDAGTRMRSMADQFFLAAGLGLPEPAMETIDPGFGRALALSSEVVWFAPLGVVARDLAAGALRRLPLDTGVTAGPVGVTLRPDRPPGEGTRALVAALREAASAIRPG